jgi:hypothetical protein
VVVELKKTWTSQNDQNINRMTRYVTNGNGCV